MARSFLHLVTVDKAGAVWASLSPNPDAEARMVGEVREHDGVWLGRAFCPNPVVVQARFPGWREAAKAVLDLAAGNL